MVSGAIIYQKLLTNHLADIATGYSEETIEFLKHGWVSALSDGNMNYLGRDENHERTASSDIKVVLPKYVTETNIQAVTHFLPVSAKLRANFIQEILGISATKHTFPSKGCTQNFLELSEQYISAFQTKFEEIKPFMDLKRKLTKPFTEIVASDTIRNDMLRSKEIGKEVVEAYVKPRFCHSMHSIRSENQPMKKNKLKVFQKHQNKKNQSNPDKQKKEVRKSIFLVGGVVFSQCR